MGNDDWSPPGDPPEIAPVFNNPPAPPPAPPAWSKAERDQMENNLAKPDPSPKLTPGGKTEQEVHTERDNITRARMSYINQMMEQRRGQAQREFNRVMDKGPER